MLSEFSQSFRQIVQQVSECCVDVLNFTFVSISEESWNKLLRARPRALRRRVVARLGVESSVRKSCGTDVEDVLEELGGLVVHPETTMET